MPSEPRSLKELFLAALEVVPAERAAWLERACGTDAELRRRVELMLAAHDTPQSLLDRLAPSDELDETATSAIGATAGRSSNAEREQAGTVVAGRYKLLEKIGEGGMGSVWMAQQTEPVKRLVALKVIKPGLDSKQVMARFEAERQALALMDHPNIAMVLDGGTMASGRPYFVMELVKGVPLTRYCDEHRLTPRQRLELFVPVCQAIQHAHQKGVIHRDIKPSNVLLALYDGRPVPKVIDFGIAKAAEPQLTELTLVTGFGAVVGTLEYMSPEQAELNQLDIDTRSDIYSLGVLLYELLTGTTPLDRKRLKDAAILEALRLIREEEPPRPSTRLSKTVELPAVAANRGVEPKKLRGLVRGELDWIVMKALEKDRNRRYETANGFATDVQRYLRDEPVRACPPSTFYRLRKFTRRNSAAVLTTLAVVASLVLAVVVLAISTVRINTALEQARLREAEALMGQAHGTRLSRRPGQRFEALAALSKAAAIGRELGQPPEWFDRLRNEAIAALALPDIHITKEFGSFPPGSVWAELNDDFTLYVRTTDKGDCTVRRVDDDREVAHLPELGEPVHAAFGAGRILVVYGTSSHRFQLWDLSGAEPALRFEATGIASGAANDSLFRNDGRLLALAHLDGSISVYDTADGERVHHLAPRQIVRGLIPQLHPTAPFVSCGSYYFSGGVQVRDLRDGSVVATATPPWRLGSGACWSLDGRTLLVAECDGGIIQEYSFDPAAPALPLIRTIQGPIMGGAGLTFSPAGDRFVRRGWGNVIILFEAVSGQELFRTHSLPSASSSDRLRFDRTGQLLAGARVGDRQDRIGLWSVADGREYRSLVHSGTAEWVDWSRPAIHPGGRLAALALSDGLALFDLESGRELAHLPISSRGCYVSFDEAGNLLTNGFEGFFRWPVRPDSANQGRLHVGPPERLPFHPGMGPIAASNDGRVIGQCMWAGYGEAAFAGGWILHPNSRKPRRVDAGQSIGACSVSPDGRWVAFGGPHLAAGRPCIHVYDAATAQCVWQSPADGGDVCSFSRDGRWLVTDTNGGRAYAVGTWEPGPQLGPGRPWDVTSDLAIMGQTDGIYRLVELATGRELARLEDPNRDFGEAAFTPDGTKLVIVAKKGRRVWDLRRIRTELAELGLDWDAPPFPDAPSSVGTPLSIHVELGDTVGLAQAYLLVEEAYKHILAKEHAKAVEKLREAVKKAPKCAVAHNNLAWQLLTGPKELRDPAQALPSARKAVELETERALYLNTLGVALYYTGRVSEAISVLERSLDQQEEHAKAFDLLFLAMCHHRQGDAAKAKDCFERGKELFQKYKGKLRPSWVEELTSFQAEAEAVLAQPPSQGKK